MSKIKIADFVSKKTGVPAAKVKEIIYWSFEALADCLCEDNYICIRSFGRWELSYKKAYLAHNCGTGKFVQKESQLKILFRPNENLAGKIKKLDPEVVKAYWDNLPKKYKHPPLEYEFEKNTSFEAKYKRKPKRKLKFQDDEPSPSENSPISVETKTPIDPLPL